MQPSQKLSRTRSRSRRANFKVHGIMGVPCPHCHKPRLPHAACENCGYVRPGLSLKVEEKE